MRWEVSIRGQETSVSDTATRRAEWETRYRTGHTAWQRESANPALLTWLAQGLLQPCRLLIPGCGRCHEVVTLAQQGFAVTGVDIAPAAIHGVRQLIEDAGVTAQVIQADLLDWDAPDPFDAVYDQTCLCALDPSTRQDYECQLFSWLRPGGQLFVLLMQATNPDGPPFPCDLDTMHQLFQDARWEWRDAEPLSIPHPAGLHELGCILTRRA